MTLLLTRMIVSRVSVDVKEEKIASALLGIFQRDIMGALSGFAGKLIKANAVLFSVERLS